MENNKNSRHERPSALRFYISGALFLLYSLIFPFYSLVHLAFGLALFGACFALCTRFLPKTAVQAEEKPVKTGDQALDSTLEKGMEYVKRIESLCSLIENAGVKSCLEDICRTLREIFKAAAQKPRKLSMLRRLLSYYLPTLLKLAEYYEKLEHVSAGENVESSLKRIEENLRLLSPAFKKQLDLLFENDALDITTDIEVMENMLKAEGLAGNDVFGLSFGDTEQRR